MKKQIKVKHHFVPRAFLSGFTEGGESDSPFWVFDTETGESRQSIPNSVAFKNHLYSIDAPGVEKDALEDAFAELEKEGHRIIRGIRTKKMFPEKEEDYETLMYYITLLAARTPTTRNRLAQFDEELLRFGTEMSLSSELMFERTKKELEKEGKRVTSSREELLEFSRKGKSEVNFHNHHHLQNMMFAINTIFETMMRRNWILVISRSKIGDFICSDNPVALNWSVQRDRGIYDSPGFGLPETEVSIPLSSRLMLLGVFEEPGSNSIGIRSKKNLAMYNSRTAGNGGRWVYSEKKEFIWYTSEGTIGDWEQISATIKNKLTAF